MKQRFIILFLSTLLISAALLSGAPREDYYSDRFLICLKQDYDVLTETQLSSKSTGILQLDELFGVYSAKTVESWLPAADENDFDGEISLNRIYRVVIDESKSDLDAALTAFSKAEALLYAEREPILRVASYMPNDPRLAQQWYIPQIKAPQAWGLWKVDEGETPGSRQIVVGIIDTGVDYLHPDLINNTWVNQGEIPEDIFDDVDTDNDGFVTAAELQSYITEDYNSDGSVNIQDALYGDSPFMNSTDDDGNGYTDDLLGWDASGASGTPDNDPMGALNGSAGLSERMHGTHVAGIAGATADNGVGIAGIGFNVSLMAVKCLKDNDSQGYVASGYQGMTYAAKSGANVINMSWGGGGFSNSHQSTINALRSNYGVVFVAAAGNGNDSGGEEYGVHYPSSYEGVISVTALGTGDRWNNWATYHETVDIAAPGENILSTVFRSSTQGYASWPGTSMASPCVAGSCALLWSFYPEADNDWIESEIIGNTDDIYEINDNPRYTGRLGSGRVNVYKAIAHAIFPELQISNVLIIMGSGDLDGDGILNPGESAKMRIVLSNGDGFATASDISAVIHSLDSNIVVIDSTGSYNSIAGGGSGTNLTDLFEIAVSAQATPGKYPMRLIVIANDTSDYPYQTEISFELEVSLNQAGFPYLLEAGVESAPLLYDLDGDSLIEIVYGDLAGNIRALKSNGTLLDSFEFKAGSKIIGAPAAADIDLDSEIEIVFGSHDKHLYVLNSQGELKWSFATGSLVNATPVLANLDEDPELEIIIGSGDKKLYVFNHDSTLMEPFPLNLGGAIMMGAAVADLNGDGFNEIIVSSYSNELLVISATGDTLEGWPQSLPQRANCEPTVVDLDGDGSLEIIIGTDTGTLLIFAADGTLKSTTSGSGAIKASPAVFPASSGMAIAYVTTTGKGYLLNSAGELFENWPVSGASFYGSVIIADLDSDGAMDIAAAANDGRIFAWNQAGENIPGFPMATGEITKSSLAVADLDNDGDFELVFGGNINLNVIDLKHEKNNVSYWPMHRYNACRTGWYQGNLSSVKSFQHPAEFSLIGNFPNPFNPQTAIRYELPAAGLLKLDVYAITGQKVSSLSKEAMPGRAEIIWDGNAMPSGIYFYKLSFQNTHHVGKMLLVK
jgi:serine protease